MLFRSHESLRLRKMLVELTTQMANIGLLTRRAEDYVNAINELDAAPTPTTAAIDELVADQNALKAAAIAQLQSALEKPHD